jgi:CelD/BcsL family acetyltransferase involved in cellulose biosynthesis
MWERRRVPLAFRFSTRTLGSVKFPLLVRTASLSERPLEADELPPRPESFGSGICGCVNWSQPISATLPRLRRRERLLVYVAHQYRRYFIDLTGKYDEYLAKFSAKSRSTLRRKMRKFEELSGGRIEWRIFRKPGELEEFFRLATPLSQSTYQERLFGHGLGADVADLESALKLAEEDQVRAYLLFLKGQPIAYLFCPVRNGALIYDKQGYDPQHSSCSPGTVLQLLALESLFKERAHSLLDFTEGEGEHKQFFSTRSQLCADIFVLRARPRLVITVMAHAAMEMMTGPLRDVLRRLGFLARVRRLLRA